MDANIAIAAASISARQNGRMKYLLAWLGIPILASKLQPNIHHISDVSSSIRKQSEGYAAASLAIAVEPFQLSFNTSLQYREQARRVYYGAVFEDKKEILV